MGLVRPGAHDSLGHVPTSDLAHGDSLPVRTIAALSVGLVAVGVVVLVIALQSGAGDQALSSEVSEVEGSADSGRLNPLDNATPDGQSAPGAPSGPDAGVAPISPEGDELDPDAAASDAFVCPPAFYDDYLEVAHGSAGELDVISADRACGEIVEVRVLQDGLAVDGQRGAVAVLDDLRIRYTATGRLGSGECLDHDWFSYTAHDPEGVEVISGIVSIDISGCA